MPNTNCQIQSFNTVSELQVILTQLTTGMDPARVLVTDEKDSLNLYIVFREGTVKIGSHSDLRDNESA